jgi:hypothetical protein
MVLKFRGNSRYHRAMANEIRPSPSPIILDVSGLPEPVVQSIMQLVKSLRAGIANRGPSGPPGQPPPLWGRFAHLDLSIPKENIDEAQSDAWQDFPRAFPVSGQP